MSKFRRGIVPILIDLEPSLGGDVLAQLCLMSALAPIYATLVASFVAAASLAILLSALLQKLVGDFFDLGEGNLEDLAGILRDFLDPSKIMGEILSGCRKRSAAKGVRSLFSFSGRFRSLFGHFF